MHEQVHRPADVILPKMAAPPPPDRAAQLARLVDEESRSVELLRHCPGFGTGDRTRPPSPACAHRWHRQAVEA